MWVSRVQHWLNDPLECPTPFVRNRCYAVQGWERDICEFCSNYGMVYQRFSLLTANREAWRQPDLARIDKRHSRSISHIVFRFALDVGMMPWTGTTDNNHVQADLEVFDFRLSKSIGVDWQMHVVPESSHLTKLRESDQQPNGMGTDTFGSGTEDRAGNTLFRDIETTAVADEP